MNTLKVILLLASLSGILMVLGALVAGRVGVLAALIISVLMNIGGYWYSDSIVLKMYDAKEVSEAQAPVIYSVVRDLAEKDKLPMPKLYILPGGTPNAFATGRSEDHAAVAVTQGILAMLTRDELEGVIGHELSHIKNRDILISTMAATVSGAVVMLASMAKWAAVFGGGQDGAGSTIGMIAMAIVAPVAATVIQMAISRSREYLADEDGAKVSGHPEALASALRKITDASKNKPMDANPATAHMFIVNPLSADMVMNLFSTHPPVEKRIERLMSMKK
jgi:heat shock protein HtpX